MKLTIQRWGQDAAIRLTEDMLHQLGATIGDTVKVTLTTEGGARVQRSGRLRYTLADLMAASKAGGGSPRIEGWENMPPVGREIL